MTEQHFALRVGLRYRAQGDGQTLERFADAEGVAAVGYPAPARTVRSSSPGG